MRGRRAARGCQGEPPLRERLGEVTGRAVRALLTAAFCVLAAVASAQQEPIAASGGPITTEDGILEFWEADFFPGGGAQPPAEDAAWYPVALPDRWRDPARYERYDQGWYRFRIDGSRKPAAQAWALMPWRVSMNAELWLNGTRLGDGGRMTPPITRNWNRPLLFGVPDGLWRDGVNEVHVRVAIHPYFGTMAPLLVGPEASLTRIHGRLTFLQITMNEVLGILTAGIAALAAAFWLRRRRETVYLWLAAACVGSTMQPIHFAAPWVPLAPETWWPLVHQSTDAWAAMLVFVGHRLAGLRRPRVELVVGTWALGAIICYALVDLPAIIPLSMPIHGVTLLTIPYLIVSLAREALGRQRSDLATFAAALTVMLGFGLHDLWLSTLADVDDWKEAVFFAPYGAPLVFLVLAWHVTGRFAAALARAEAAKEQLEARVAAATVEIERIYADRNRLATREAAAEERQRIYTDLHDDLGARLLGLVYALDGHPARSEAHGALAELREIVTAPPPESDVPLEAMLRRWQDEAEQRLRAGGVGLHWHQDARFDDVSISGRKLYHLTRMLREAISNVLHHASAVRVDVHVLLGEGALRLDVIDDGSGLAGNWRAGRGMTSLRQRAEEIGADYELVSNKADDRARGGGCRCTFRLPLEA